MLKVMNKITRFCLHVAYRLGGEAENKNVKEEINFEKVLWKGKRTGCCDWGDKKGVCFNRGIRVLGYRHADQDPSSWKGKRDRPGRTIQAVRATLQRSSSEKEGLVFSNSKAGVSKGGGKTYIKLVRWVGTKSCTNFYVPLTLGLPSSCGIMSHNFASHSSVTTAFSLKLSVYPDCFRWILSGAWFSEAYLPKISRFHCQNRSGKYPKTVGHPIGTWGANSL